MTFFLARKFPWNSEFVLFSMPFCITFHDNFFPGFSMTVGNLQMQNSHWENVWNLNSMMQIQSKFDQMHEILYHFFKPWLIVEENSSFMQGKRRVPNITIEGDYWITKDIVYIIIRSEKTVIILYYRVLSSLQKISLSSEFWVNS